MHLSRVVSIKVNSIGVRFRTCNRGLPNRLVKWSILVAGFEPFILTLLKPARYLAVLVQRIYFNAKISLH